MLIRYQYAYGLFKVFTKWRVYPFLNDIYLDYLKNKETRVYFLLGLTLLCTPIAIKVNVR